MDSSEDDEFDDDFLQELDIVEQSLNINTNTDSQQHNSASAILPDTKSHIQSQPSFHKNVIPQQQQQHQPHKVNTQISKLVPPPSFTSSPAFTKAGRTQNVYPGSASSLRTMPAATTVGGAARPPPPHLPSSHRLPPPDPELAKKLARPPRNISRWSNSTQVLNTNSPEPSTSSVTSEVLELRQQLKEIQDSYEAKLGEVANLRRGLKKEQDDAGRIRAEWEAEKQTLETRLRESAKAHTLDLERMQTEYAFKRQELETSVRRGARSPSSIRRKVAPSSSSIRARPGDSSPLKHATLKSSRLSARPFHNSFDDAPSSSPSRPPITTSVRKKRSKKHHHHSQLDESLDQETPLRTTAQKDKEKVSASLTHESDYFEGIPMDFDIQTDGLMQPDQSTEPFAPKIIFALFAHNSFTSEGLYIPTLNLLIETKFSEEHDKLVRELFEWIGVAGSLNDVSLIGKLDDILTGLLSVLFASGKLVNATAVILLASNLSLMFPIISWCMLNHPLFHNPEHENNDLHQYSNHYSNRHHSKFLLKVAKMIGSLCQKDIHEDASSHKEEYFLCATLYLLQALAFNPTDACLVNLENFVKEWQIPGIFLSPEQPLTVISSTVRWIYKLSTYPSLFRSILSSVPVRNGMQEGRVPIIDRLATLLTYNFEEDAEYEEEQILHELQLGILRILWILTSGHEDAVTLLSESVKLVGMLICRVAMDVTVLLDRDYVWHQNKGKAAEMVLSRIKATMGLLHYLTRAPSFQMNLRGKLEASHSHINGIHHLFVVSVGQLAVVDPPYWLEKEEINLFETCSDYAKELLESVLSPEEQDEIFQAVNGDEPEKHRVNNGDLSDSDLEVLQGTDADDIVMSSTA